MAFLACVTCSCLLTGSRCAVCAEEKAPEPQNKKDDRVKELFQSMRDGKYTEKGFPNLVLADVPALLELADSTTTLKTFPRNLLSSQFEPDCSEGMVALWLIEGVRVGGKFPSLNALCFMGRVEGENWTKASEDNHKEVAKAYRSWWEKAKSLSPEKAMALDPLKDSKLHWY